MESEQQLPAFDLAATRLRLTWSDRLYRIEGNVHTHLGRFSVLDVETGRYELCSRADIAWASDSAAAWIAGFLAGNAPSTDAVFGDNEESDDQLAWWQELCERFERTGVTPARGIFPAEPVHPVVAAVRDRAWSAVGYSVIAWDGSAWVVTGDSSDDRLAGTPCADDGHELEELDGRRLTSFCPRCGLFGQEP